MIVQSLRLRRLVKRLLRPGARMPFILALALIGMVLLFAVVFSLFEKGISFGDGLWTAYVTLTTIGYGDIFAKTFEGRLVTIITSMFGIGCFGVFTGIIVEKAMQRRLKKMKGEGNYSSEGHLVIVNVPSYEEIRELLNELDLSPDYGETPRILMTGSLPNQDREIPLAISERIDGFVMGIPSTLETLERVNMEKARACILLSSSVQPTMDDTNTLTASLIEKHWSQIITIIDCSRSETLKNLRLFSIDGGVSATDLQMGLLVQELTSQGIFNVYNQLSSHVGGSQLYISRTTVGQWNAENKKLTFGALKLAMLFLNLSVDVLGINRKSEKELLLNPSNEQELQPSDYLVYMAKKRFEWSKNGSEILRQMEKLPSMESLGLVEA
ncbi:MAG: potassium channel family protein [Nitrospinota bacterium]|nr:potassium channel family protein [Nitrospinota bacterium]